MAEQAKGGDGQVHIGTPTVVVSHIDVKYTVFGGGKKGVARGQGGARSLKDRLRNRPEPRVREVHAVKDVSFVARHGESIGIIGRNGSGKSTLLRAVAGLIPASAGRLWVSGEPSLLGVNAVLMSKLSGERNIYVGGQALGLTKEEIAQRFDDIVEFSGIGDAVYLPMNTYSSGMGARLRFAISTAATPDVLMIDEALATGDADFREKSAARISEIRENAGTVFLVSHSNGNIRQICDRVLWMDQGRLIMDGPTDEVLPAYEATLPKRVQKKVATPVDADVPGTVRHTGDNRLDVATTIVRETWEPGVGGVFVVSLNRVAAARAVVPVAARLGWPILWVRPSSVPSGTRDELVRLAPEKVVVVGGDELISAGTRDQIEEFVGHPIQRIDTDDPAITSARLLTDFPPPDSSTVHLTLPSSSGSAPVISQIASTTGRALVVCEATEAPEELLSALSTLAPRQLVLDGDEEDWAVEVVEQLRAATGATVSFGPEGGPMALAAELYDDVTPGGQILVSASATVVEILTTAVASVHSGKPLLLVRSERVPALVRRTIQRLAPREIALVGTFDALPPAIRKELGKLVVTGPPPSDAPSGPASAG